MYPFFKIKTPRFVIGIAFALTAAVITCVLTNNVKASLLFAALFVGSGCISIENTVLSSKIKLSLYSVWFIITAFVTRFLSELVLNEQIISLGLFRIVLGMIICLILFLFLYAITLHPVISVSIALIFLVFGTIVNYYVYRFRGSELQPADLLSITTAGDVAGAYKIVPTNTIIYALILAFLYLFLSFGLPSMAVKNKFMYRVVLGGLDIVLLVVFLFSSRHMEFYNYLNSGSKTNGYFLNFSLQMKETFVKKPNPYSLETITNLSFNYSTSEAKNQPDLIVIMDESFADLSYLGSPIFTNMKVTPYIDSLQENTVKGYALSSVFGGNTATSEFEFLTGHTQLFLPTGSVAYQQYVRSNNYSLVSEFNNLGYVTIAMHPNEARCWARDDVYKKFGFDEVYFLDAFPNQDFQRDFISDQEMFETIISKYEDHKETSNEPVFIFGVTIQNHGGYDYSGNNYEKTISLEGYSQDYSDVEQYLSMLHETDKAVDYLLDYLSKIEQDVVVVFYGDHYPSLNENFFEEVHGGSFDTLDEQQKKYTIPFFIWTNYDSKEEEIQLTSLNFLSNYVYASAGIPLPEYNQALHDIMIIIPVINANGYYSLAEGRFLKQYEATGDERNCLNLYNQLEYNALFDTGNRNEEFFPFR